MARLRVVVAPVLGLAVAATAVVAATGAGAEEGTRVSGDGNGAEVEVWSDPGARPGRETAGGAPRPRSGTADRSCVTLVFPTVDGVYAEYGRADVGTGWLDFRICSGPGILDVTRRFRPLPGPPGPVTTPAATRAAERARAVLEPPALAPRLDPAPPAAPLAGLETWIWIDGADWEPVTATAAVAGISATVTATPVGLTWDLDEDGPPVTCDGPGTAYDPGRPASEQATDCSAVFGRRGRHETILTTRWQVTWSASDGNAGSLPDVTSVTPLTVTVRERYAVG